MKTGDSFKIINNSDVYFESFDNYCKISNRTLNRIASKFNIPNKIDMINSFNHMVLSNLYDSDSILNYSKHLTTLLDRYGLKTFSSLVNCNLPNTKDSYILLICVARKDKDIKGSDIEKDFNKIANFYDWEV